MLLDSEYAGNVHLAETLTALGHPIAPDEAMARFMGLSGADFLDAIAGWIGGPVPEPFHALRAEEDARVLREGLEEIEGAVRFVEGLPPTLPRAVASSSSTAWVRRHLKHLGLRSCFEPYIFSGREHVARGKPAPDLYLHAARAIGVEIGRTLIVEDSPVGVTGAVASGAYVVGLCAGRHCLAGHADRLRALGVNEVADSFGELERLIT